MTIPRFNFDFKESKKVKDSSNEMSDMLNSVIKSHKIELTDEQLDLLSGNYQTEEIKTDQLLEEPIKEEKIEVIEKEEKKEPESVKEVKEVDENSDSKKILDADDRVESSEHKELNDAMVWAIKEADDDTHGYTLNTEERWGNPGYDCSTLVISAFEAAGFNVKELGASNCSNMKDAFLATGKFEWIPGDPKVEELKPGDVLLNSTMHTEMYVGKGNNVGAHDDRDGVQGDGSGTEVNVQGYWSPPWEGVLRFKG